MAITISGSGITSANIADGTIVNADVADVAASKLTGALPAIDGSALTGVGKVLQVVTGTLSSVVTTSSTSFVTTGLDATITLNNSANKVYMIANIDFDNEVAYRRGAFSLFAGETDMGATRSLYDENRAYTNLSISYVNTPASTGPHTYSLRFKSASGGAISVNAYTASFGHITLMEIEA